jgi:cell division protease FtsH
MPMKNRIRIWGPRIAGVLVCYLAYLAVFPAFVNCLADGLPAPCTVRHAHAAIPKILVALLPLLLVVVAAIAFGLIQFVGIFYFLSRGRTYTIYPHEYDVSFEDVRGQQAVVASVKEVVNLFRGFRDFRKIGGYPPHGILFEGPPGTGKTLLAKAVAGTVGVPFIYAPATGFSNMFMGVGSLRVWALFRKAKRFARRYDGTVIFLDEIDAIGARGSMQTASAPPDAQRGLGLARVMRFVAPGGSAGSGIVNELLVQMDGLVMPYRGLKRHVRRWLRLAPRVPSHNILIIGATNRSQDLDPALLRPGRFDRKIHVGLPDKEGRKDVIRFYMSKVRHEPIDLDKFAQATTGFSPARIRNIINEALIVALQSGRAALSWEDIWQAKLIDEIGLAQPVTYTKREKEMTAVHEAGHAVASRELQSADKQIQVITIIKREAALGQVHTVDLEERFADTKDEILNEIKVLLAGQAAEELWFGTCTEGAASDLYWSTILALKYVGLVGMGRRLVSYAVIPRESGTGTPHMYAQMLADPEVRDEVDVLLRQCKSEVTALLERRRPAVEQLRDELLEREELVGIGRAHV